MKPQWPLLANAFNLFAPLYDRLTANHLWRDSIREMARHLPPSGPTLRLLDLGGGPANSARALSALRPDLAIAALDISPGMICTARAKINRAGAQNAIQLLRADGCYLPFTSNSLDAITAHSLYYLIADQDKAQFLAEALRVLRPGGRFILLDPAQVPYPFAVIGRAPLSAPSVLLWYLVSRAYRRVTPESMARALEKAGFSRVFGEKAVAGYGVLSRGEKSYPAAAGTMRTVEVVRRGATATVAAMPDQLMPMQGPSLLALPGPFIFLLIRQTPNQPVWTLAPGTILSWTAISVVDLKPEKQGVKGDPLALAFTSLPKAVAFMQPAVKEGRILGVSRIAKFDKKTAARWPFALMLNPDLSALSDTKATDDTAASFKLLDIGLAVDPYTAVSGDE
jgi:ubiquinone/menaquinone biosynthesis C-methylase UbiE